MVRNGEVRMKNLGNAGKAHNTIYIFNTFTTSGSCLLDHTHTTDALIKNEVCFLACKVFVASVVFCAQNLIRDG